MTTVRELPDPKTMFVKFMADAGDAAAARTRFQRLITDLVKIKIPSATEVEYPGGGDWGIDTYAGRLDADIVVWQSKFFLEWGTTQQAQIRDSFKQLNKNAQNEGFRISAWTLCVPSVLPPDIQKWFDNWRNKKQNETGIQIDIKNGTDLRSDLLTPDCEHLRQQYFSTSAPVTRDVPLARILNPAAFSEALFVTQLEEAGYRENEGARGLFFAAEAMARDVANRNLDHEIDALYEAELEIKNLWEHAYHTKFPTATKLGRMDGIVEDVTNQAAELEPSRELKLRRVHRLGMVHRIVERQQAGWVTHWRDVVSRYEGTSAFNTFTAAGTSPSTLGPAEDGKTDG